MNTSPHTERNLRRAVLWQNVRQWWPGVLILAIILGLGTWWVTEPIRIEADMHGMPLQTGTATVKDIIRPPVYRYRPDASPVVMLNIEDRVAVTRTDLPLNIGQAVQVTYRIGRSGRVYVGSVTPLRPER